jgi:hypothetical protein
MIETFATAGFDDPRIVARFDCFAGTTKERTARRYGVVGANVLAVRTPS